MDHKRNYESLEELRIDSFEEILYARRSNWIQHAHRMQNYKLTNKFRNTMHEKDNDLKRLLKIRTTGNVKLVPVLNRTPRH